MSVFSIPEFTGSVSLQTYSQVIDRIRQFENYSVIGTDESGNYDIYKIELGDESKPTLLVIASMHGSEWQGTSYGLSFFESLKDGDFPDSNLMNRLLNDFHLVFIPVVNPYGFNNTTEYAVVNGRLNFNGEDLNRDFFNFTQSESRAVRNVMLETRPFAFLDIHMIRRGLEDNHLIVGNGQYETIDIRDDWAESLSEYSGKSVERWTPFNNMQRGLARRYMRDRPNSDTPYTLSYITEMARPVNESDGFVAPLTDSEIMKYGKAQLYAFMYTSVEYYDNNKFVGSGGGDVSEIEKIITPYGEIIYTRNEAGHVERIEEQKNDYTLVTDFTRDDNGALLEYTTERV